MKYLSFAIVFACLIFSFSCKKEDGDPTQNPSGTDTVTNVIKCRITYAQNFDGSGQLTSTATSYYTGVRLDSVVYNYATGLVQRTIYQDLGNGETKVYDPSVTNNYSIVVYDQYRNITEYRSYNNGNLSTRSLTTYECN